ncbi:uncharacterized protein LOC144647729 [Oculina patagonica]
MFLSRLQPTASSKYSGTCSSPACPGPTKDFTSYSISLSDVGIPPPAFLQCALDDWMATDTRQSTCSLSLGQIVPGAPHYLGVVNYIHPVTSQVMQQYHYYCGGEEVVHKETVCGWRPSFSTNFSRILRSERHHHRCFSDSSLCDDERRKVYFDGNDVL